MDAKPFVTIVIPFKNEEKYIAACLEGIAGLDYPRDRYEVITLDNGSTDASEAIVRGFGVHYELALGTTISMNRNRGARQGRGEILAFVDADCVVPPDWLNVAAALFASDPAIGIVGSYYRIPPDASWIAHVWNILADAGDPARDPYEARWFPAGNLIARRELFERIGGFDERLMTSEDWDICRRAHEAGSRIVGSSRLAVLHLKQHKNMANFFKKEMWYGSHVYRMFRKEPGKMNGLIPLAMGAYTLLATLVVAALAAGLAARQVRMAGLLVGICVLYSPFALAAVRTLHLKKLPQTLALSLSWLLYAYGLARGVALVRSVLFEK